jgi:DNA-binding CsgD family transcriptional regulator
MAELPLSAREKQLLRRLAKGMPAAEIAQSIGGTPNQVREQRSRLLSKLRIASQAELVEVAQRLAPWPGRERRHLL